MRLLLLSMAAACASWAMTREELGREVKEFGMKISYNAKYPWIVRKLAWPLHCGVCQAAWWAGLGSLWEGVGPVEWLSMTWMAWLWLALMARVGT